MSSGRTTITHEDVYAAAQSLAAAVRRFMDVEGAGGSSVRLYGVPRGGIPAAYALASFLGGTVVSAPSEADIIVDDLIDSGATMHKYQLLFPTKPFAALFLRKGPAPAVAMYGTKLTTDDWLDFPWEETASGFRNKEDSVVRMIEAIGDDPSREGLRDTPTRVVKAWDEWFKGYRQSPADFMRSFTDGAEGYDGMIIVDSIPVYSHCEHHITPFIGHAHVGYIPSSRIVGLSKIPKIVDMYARRLQVQERLTTQIADCMMEALEPKGVIVSITAAHLCMVTRGVKLEDAVTTTSARRGLFMDDASACAEFFSLLPPRSAKK